MSELDTAWEAALAAEHQATFGYPLLGPHVAPAQHNLAYACGSAHEALRDVTQAALLATGRTPVAAAVDYPSLYPVQNTASALRLAVRLEDDCATAWRYLYLRAASTSGARARTLRTSAQSALTASAVRGVQWRAVIDPQHATEPFPGL